MTTIAWDGRTLAADRRCTVAGFTFDVSKMRRTADGRLLGLAGDFRSGQRWLDWLEKPDGARGPMPASDKEAPMVLEVRRNGRCYRMCGGSFVEVCGPEFHAIGSGRDFAIAGMALGLTAIDAVKLAHRFDCYTGIDVDTLELERLPAPEGELECAA